MARDEKHGEQWKRDFFSARTKLAELFDLRKRRYTDPSIEDKIWKNKFLLWGAQPNAGQVEWGVIEEKIGAECAKYNRFADRREKWAKLAAMSAGVGFTTLFIIAATHASLSSNTMFKLGVFGAGFPLVFSLLALAIAQIRAYDFPDAYKNSLDPLAGLTPAVQINDAGSGGIWSDPEFLAAHTTFAKLIAINEKYKTLDASKIKQGVDLFYAQMTRPDAVDIDWDALNTKLSQRYAVAVKSIIREKRMEVLGYVLSGAVISTSVVAATCSSSLSARAMSDLMLFGGIIPFLLCVGLVVILDKSQSPSSDYAEIEEIELTSVSSARGGGL